MVKLAGAILHKGMDHVKRKGQGILALQKCPTQAVKLISKIAPGSSGGSRALLKSKNMER